MMKTPARQLAEKLLQSNAIKLQPQIPFVWGSGWNSPIYNDNRRTLSYPDIRNFIKVEMARQISERFPEVDALAGVSSGAIAYGAIVADCLGLPFAYVRESPKDHGLENMIEGNLRPGQKVVVIEDLIGTGGSSLKAIEAIRRVGCEPVGMVALFSYEFPLAVQRFRQAGIPIVALSDYTTMLEAALALDYVGEEEMATLREWREDPSSWTPPVAPLR